MTLIPTLFGGSIRGRILLAGVGFAIIITTVAWIVIAGQWKTTANLDQLNQVNQLVSLTNELTTDTVILQRDVLIYKETANVTVAEKIQVLLEQINRELETIRHLHAANDVQQDQLAQMQSHLQDYRHNFASVVDNRNLRRQLVNEKLVDVYESVIDDLSRVVNSSNGDDMAQTRAQLVEIKNFLQLARNGTLQFLRRADSGQIKIVKATLANAIKLIGQVQSDKADVSIVLARIQGELNDYESTFLTIVQTTRAYLYLINVVMAGDLGEFIRLSRALNQSADEQFRQISTQTDRELSRLGDIEFSVSGIAVLIALLLAWRLSETLVGPVRRLTGVFNTLSEDKPVSSIPGIERNDELGKMAAAADVFRQKNAEARKLLKINETLNRELEQRVEERTKDLNESKFALQQALAEERRARDDLRLTDERLQLALDASGIGTWDWDLVTGIAAFDEQMEAMIGMPVGSFSGQLEDFFPYVHAEDRDGVQAEIDKTLNTIGAGFNAEYRIVKPDQSIRYVNARGEVKREQGKAVRMNGTFQDISERKAIELELETARDAAEEASIAKSQFLANMSHELRTPLNAIIGYSEILAEDADEAGELQLLADLDKIGGSGRHLLNLINDILDLSKVESGKMELSTEVIAVRDVVEEVVATMQPAIQNNHNSLIVNCDQAVDKMETDPQKLRQILFNLLSNAAKFTQDGRIEFDVTHSGPGSAAMLEFAVRDSGIGIDSTQMARLFQPFMQGDASTTRDYGGTGLGLVISRRMAELLGGDIQVRSSPGEGSVFTLVLPVQASETEQPNPAMVETDSALISMSKHALPGRRVLVIDDEAQARELICAHLQRAGWQVITASDGESGLQLAREQRPNAITLDVMMPKMDGWSVLQRLKADPELAQIPVIMCTIVDEKERGFALGATDHLLKPVPRDQLLDTLQKYFAANTGHVMVVDDELSARELLLRNLEDSGWIVTQAADGRECLQQLAEQLPDIILLDLMMPEMDGFAVIEALQQNSQWQQIPVIVITAKELTRKERQWLNARFAHVMEKGQYRRDELLAEVTLRLNRVLTHDDV